MMRCLIYCRYKRWKLLGKKFKFIILSIIIIINILLLVNHHDTIQSSSEVLNEFHLDDLPIQKSIKVEITTSLLQCFHKNIFGLNEDYCLYRLMYIEIIDPMSYSPVQCSCTIKYFNEILIEVPGHVNKIEQRNDLRKSIFEFECYFKRNIFPSFYKSKWIRIDVFIDKTSFVKNLRLNNIGIRKLLSWTNQNEMFVHNICYCTSPIILNDVGDVHDIVTHLYYYMSKNISLIVINCYEKDDSLINLMKKMLGMKMKKNRTKLIFHYLQFNYYLHFEIAKIIGVDYCFSLHKYECRSFIMHDPDEIIVRTNEPNFNLTDFFHQNFQKYSTHHERRCIKFDANLLLTSTDTKLIYDTLTNLSRINDFLKMSVSLKLSNFVTIQLSLDLPNRSFCRKHFEQLLQKLNKFENLMKNSSFKGHRYLRPLIFDIPPDHGQQKYVCLTPNIFALSTHNEVNYESKIRKTFDQFTNISNNLPHLRNGIWGKNIPKTEGIVLHHRIEMKKIYKKRIEKVKLYNCNQIYYNVFNEIFYDIWD
ncbi:hypothetical protein SNEBB_007108 [Seison nebaliae]|nr:hypothetical protein SNEBB_007108 [Seison nebaliae]